MVRSRGSNRAHRLKALSFFIIAFAVLIGVALAFVIALAKTLAAIVSRMFMRPSRMVLASARPLLSTVRGPWLASEAEIEGANAWWKATHPYKVRRS